MELVEGPTLADRIAAGPTLADRIAAGPIPMAKAIEIAGAGAGAAPLITTPAMTRAGLVLGTAAYMSPEHARGHAVDRRSDVWSSGCVLYETRTGQVTFHGVDTTDTIAAVVRIGVSKVSPRSCIDGWAGARWVRSGPMAAAGPTRFDAGPVNLPLRGGNTARSWAG